MSKLPKEIEELIDALLAKMKPNHTKEERNKFERHLMTSIWAYLSIPKEEGTKELNHLVIADSRNKAKSIVDNPNLYWIDTGNWINLVPISVWWATCWLWFSYIYFYAEVNEQSLSWFNDIVRQKMLPWCIIASVHTKEDFIRIFWYDTVS